MTVRWRNRISNEIAFVLERFEHAGTRYVTWKYPSVRPKKHKKRWNVVTAPESDFLIWHRKIRLIYK